jgi:hypothetical protein
MAELEGRADHELALVNRQLLQLMFVLSIVATQMLQHICHVRSVLRCLG